MLLPQDFQYELPEELIAQHPLKKRGASRLLTCRSWDKKIQDNVFPEIPKILNELFGAKTPKLFLINNTRVYPARVRIQRETGGRGEVFFLNQQEQDIFSVLLRPKSKLKKGEILYGTNAEKTPLFIVENLSPPLVTLCEDQKSLPQILKEYGEMPLPPYIQRRNATAETAETDQERYQTVYHNPNQEGSSAAPTAGLHFTAELMDKFQEQKIEFAEVTLHVGLGTFAPIQSDTIADHKMHEEVYCIPKETAQKIANFLENDWPIFFVGTTSLRSVESFLRKIFSQCSLKDLKKYAQDGTFLEKIQPFQDQWLQTHLFLYPTHANERILPQLGHGILTNFHQPESTLTMLVAALMGYDFWKTFYSHAIDKKYRFLSYGDSSLLLFRKPEV